MTPKDRYYIDYGTFMNPLVFDRTTKKVVASFECLGYALGGNINTKTDEKKIFHSSQIPSRIADEIIRSLNSGDIDIDGKSTKLSTCHNKEKEETNK